MNTKDIQLDLDALPWGHTSLRNNEGDLLATIFAGQEELMEKYHEIEKRNGCVVVEPELRGEIDDRDVQMRVKDLMERCIEELMESANTLKNKPWKNTFVATDRDHFYEELADALHFFIELCITVGLDADSLFKLYFRKHAVNQFRQESNY